MSSKIVEALELALRLSAQTNDEFTEHDRALIESALAEARAAVSAEPVAWAISYDGKTPYQLFSSEDCYLLDCEVKRIGGTACKIPLYTTPPSVEASQQQTSTPLSFRIRYTRAAQAWVAKEAAAMEAELSRLTAALSDVSGRSAEMATKAADEIERLTAELEAAKAEAEALRKDAERYRQIRRGQRWSVVDGIGNELRADNLDAVVDAAIAAQQGKGGVGCVSRS